MKGEKQFSCVFICEPCVFLILLGNVTHIQATVSKHYIRRYSPFSSSRMNGGEQYSYREVLNDIISGREQAITQTELRQAFAAYAAEENIDYLLDVQHLDEEAKEISRIKAKEIIDTYVVNDAQRMLNVNDSTRRKV